MTPDTTPTNNQPQYSDNQSFKIDIDAFYDGFIKQIDAIRSNVSIVDNSTQIANFIKQLNSDNPPTSTIISQLKIDPNNPHESRCHAFYRLLGLPSFEPGGSFYSPGLIHGSVNNIGSNAINLNSTKINVAQKLTSIYPLMDQREKNINQFLQIFSVSNIDASVLALSSTKIRKFGVLPSNNTIDPFDTDITHQSYPIPNDTQNLTGTADFLGSDGYGYQDSNGNFPSTKVVGFLLRRAHIIKPFMVDPRVELTINPPYVGSPGTGNNTVVCKIMGAPFPTDKSQHQYVENVYASSSVIEAVCRARLTVGQPITNLSARQQAITNYITNTDVTKDADLLEAVMGQAAGLNNQDNQVFLKYINIMRSMMDVLYNAINNIYDVEDAQDKGIPFAKYHWVPIPNVKGPEFGSTTQGIIIGDPLNTNADLAIVNTIIQTEISQINSQNIQNNKPDLGNFVNFETIPLSPDDQSTSSLGNIDEETMDDMVNKRTAQTDKANAALRHIEIIMGEFSGFGLCDIIAIYLALWTIDKQDLVNMLDDGAFSRLAQDPALQSQEVVNRVNQGKPTNSIVTTMTNFEQQVINNYAIMDKLWEDRNQNQGISNIG